MAFFLTSLLWRGRHRTSHLGRACVDREGLKRGILRDGSSENAPAKDANVVFCVVALAKATPTKSTFLVLSEKLEVHLQALQGVGATQS